MQNTLKEILISELLDHPQNPRIALREDVVSAIAAGLSEGFDPAHALIVRPVGETFQIISGHHRKAAAAKLGIESVPCWVRELDDDAAYMALVTSNSQGELSPLERGIHACKADGKHGDTKAYAESICRPRSSVQLEKQAGRVAISCTCNLSDPWQKHGAQWLSTYGTRKAPNKTYNTLNCPVPVHALFPAIGAALRIPFGLRSAA